MIRVLLVHAGSIPHYRIPMYGYLFEYLKKYNFDLWVISEEIQAGSPPEVRFPYLGIPLSVRSISRIVREKRIDIVIDYMELKHWYLFPTYLVVKFILKKIMIYWGQGGDLLDPSNVLKKAAYAFEQSMCGAIILYAEHLKTHIPRRFLKKTFFANNTMLIEYSGLPQGVTRESVMMKYGIKTKRNVICVGRMQKRKRIDHLIKAFEMLNRTDVGLILVGPDPDHLLKEAKGSNIHILGPLYENKKNELLSAADVYCLPGAVGLSIVDAFQCGLPFVTEAGDESAEIMYLKDGVNGFIVPRNDISALSRRLRELLDDQELRKRFSEAARKEIQERASMDVFCRGFRDALEYCSRSDRFLVARENNLLR